MPADPPLPAGVAPGTVPLGTALSRTDLDRPVTEVAPWLLGRVLLCAGAGGLVAVRLTEVEAYDGERDPGSHAFRGRTARNATMFGPAGHAYVYFTYGLHWCVNVVCGPVGRASAVLLRAGEVVRGRELARARRTSARADRDLARGPARLTVALGIDGSRNGADLLGSGAAAAGGSSSAVAAGEAPPTATAGEAPLLRLLSGVPAPASAVRTGPRVGVGGAGADLPWRFWLAGEPTVSAYRRHVPRDRRPTAPTRLADPTAGTSVQN